MERIGFIGLGIMGLQMSKRLIESGYFLIVHDKDQKLMGVLVGRGARSENTPREVAFQTDIVISMLPTPLITREVLLGENGAIYGFHPGSVYIDMSTSNPIITKEIYEALKEREVEMLDAPVSGGMEGASAGTLSIMVGGNRQVFEKVKPILECMGKKIFFIGQIGSGHIIKLINNMLFSVIMAATAEALVFGKKSGIDPVVLREVINSGSGRSYAMDIKVRDFILPRDFTPGFSVDLQNKDIDLACQLAKDMGIPLILASLVRQIYQTLLVKGYGGKDTSIIIKFFEDLMGSDEIKGDLGNLKI